MKCTYFSLFLLLLFGVDLSAQKPYLATVGLEEGLPTQTVYDVLEDRDGYIWVGTDQGVFRYNGSQFKQVNLPNARYLNIDNLRLDANGHIWAKNYANQLFHWNSNEWIEHQIEVDERIKLGSLQHFIFKDQHLRLVYEKCIIQYHPIDRSFRIEHQLSYDGNTFLELVLERDTKNEWIEWLSTERALLRNSDVYLDNLSIPFTDIALVDSIILWVNRAPFSQAGWVVEPSKKIYSLEVDCKSPYYWRKTSEAFWLCSSNGAWKSSKQGLQEWEQLLPKNRVSDVLEDREGNLWFSTLDNGLWLRPKQVWQHLELQEIGLPAASYPTRLLPSNDDGIWIGTQNGWIAKLDHNLNALLAFNTQSESEVEFLYEDTQNQRLLFTQG